VYVAFIRYKNNMIILRAGFKRTVEDSTHIIPKNYDRCNERQQGFVIEMYPMKNFFQITCLGIVLLLLISCEKSHEILQPPSISSDSGFINYTIRSGEHFCDQNPYRETNYSELKFNVRFDSTAIYQTDSAQNQLDINKLYGFSDNNDQHHLYSARFGWRWSDGALRLFGYTYNSGEMSYEELKTIEIGTEYHCSIKVNPTDYVFTINETSKSMLRSSTTATAIGYRLYPYFGGNEAAPHDIHILIKEL